jgi:hypothetical protein
MGRAPPAGGGSGAALEKCVPARKRPALIVLLALAVPYGLAEIP